LVRGHGKSSLAKAILNNPLVTAKFADRRFFVNLRRAGSFDYTFETFVTRFAGALGIESAGADPMRQIFTLLRSASALIVLDNAETFEEASASSALREIPPAIADIANIAGVVLISHHAAEGMRRTCNDNKDIPPLDLSSAQTLFFQIYRRASRSDDGEE